MGEGRPAASSARALEAEGRREAAWLSVCAAFFAGGVLLGILAVAFALAPGPGSAVPAILAGVAAVSFAVSYGSWRACLACRRRCDVLRGRG